MKDKFAKGDEVVFKGFEPTEDTIMVVERINWKTTSSGRMKGTIDAPFLDSITVMFYDDKGNLINKDVHSNEIVKVNLLPEYYIKKAISKIENETLITKLQEVIKEL